MTRSAVCIPEAIEFTHPKLVELQNAFVQGVTASLHRAIRMGQDAGVRASMPTAPDSLEQIFARYLGQSAVAARIKDSAARMSAPQTPAGVNLASNAPIMDQQLAVLKGARYGLTPDDVKQIIGSRRPIRGGDDDLDLGGQVPGTDDPSTRKLIQLRIHKVRCVKETSEWGDDEISLGGVMIDDEGKTLKISETMIAKNFNTGETKSYAQPRVLANFVARKNGQRKIVLATLSMAEKDQGGFASFLNDLWSKVTAQATLFVAGLYAAMEAFVASLGIMAGLVPTYILTGLMVGSLIGAAITAALIIIGQLLKDEVFKPVSSTFYIPTIDTLVVTPPAVASFAGFGGRYEVTYDWAVVD